MKKALKYILYALGVTLILFFCVSATAGIPDAADAVRRSFSEPINMVLLGIGLIGLGSFVKNRLSQ